MKVLLDTSVLVAAMVEAHPDHKRALPWLQHAKKGTYQGLISAHSLAELYAVLTRLPIQPKISPSLANQLLQDNVLDTFEIVSLSKADYAEIIGYLSKNNIIGGVTYDALQLHAAWKAQADQIVTINHKDFRRIYPHLADKIVSPTFTDQFQQDTNTENGDSIESDD